ncbi:aldehyde ferredoxin oxidoreductase family protein [Natrarchaeobaculum aegyptiacum]|uniref:Aldehyde ferredoxin oxidoreductase n=1 Tax=Natrarchaeobaculum aegyptiacum TaxID=745377 RepID=A0A2Z2HQY7_9EURY|nr:aldehyde ferredoxin oxidoreductase C-terminal domain-containing protein [Natrarchaeobaculum aegyptiacum]ARS89566.1 aldehyde ferredoxin oxidoreductase [Natrarchaeobaculum aegyptiacum]
MPVADRILRVDLSRETVTSRPIPERWLAQYVGGKGIGARYLYEELEPGTDPLSPANALLFMTGPLTGLLPGEQRYAAITKSPLTGTFLDSYGGGTFPGRLAGSLENHMGIVVTGEAEEPVVLSVANGEATLESAADLAGLDAAGTDEAFPNAAVACIGPAGENGVRYATIASDGGDHHAGRGGAGTVMGAKNLKAVVAHDPPAEPDSRTVEALKERDDEAFAASDAGQWLTSSDTLETVDFANEVGVLPTRGWQEDRFEGADDIGIEQAREAATERERPEDAVPGGFRVEHDDGESVVRGATPIVFGAGLGIDDFDAVATLGARCDQLGMDVITAGNAVAWAIRASQEGLLERDLSFGDETAARELVDEIATRSSPLGDALADGVDRAAEDIGGEDLVPTVKGMELSSYHPGNAKAMALAYATSDRGGCHRRARPVELEPVDAETWSRDRAAERVIDEQDRRAVLWSLIADDFLEDVLQADLGSEWLTAAGYDHEPTDLERVGERIWTLVRLFNVREGFSREDDALPGALSADEEDSSDHSEAATDEPNGIDAAVFESVLEHYYDARDWDREGRPTRDLLERLDLVDLVDDPGALESLDTGPDPDENTRSSAETGAWSR